MCLFACRERWGRSSVLTSSACRDSRGYGSAHTASIAWQSSLPYRGSFGFGLFMPNSRVIPDDARTLNVEESVLSSRNLTEHNRDLLEASWVLNAVRLSKGETT